MSSNLPIVESGVVHLSDTAWTEARRRAKVIRFIEYK
jgi:hypothetical protein